jgi:hypothetical protein
MEIKKYIFLTFLTPFWPFLTYAILGVETSLKNDQNDIKIMGLAQSAGHEKLEQLLRPLKV